MLAPHERPRQPHGVDQVPELVRREEDRAPVSGALLHVGQDEYDAGKAAGERLKEMGGKLFVITDAGMNDLLRPSHYSSYHRVGTVRPVEGRESRTVDVVGPICESGDFLALDRELAVPEPGDVLAIHTTGAYGFSMASTYNARPRPAEVLVEGGASRLIRRREAYDDLVRGEEDLLIE